MSAITSTPSKRIALFPGSFDPPSSGHLDIIRRAARLCDELIVGVGYNPAKVGTFTIEERLDFIARLCHDLPNVRAVKFEGLLMDAAEQHNVTYVVRGLRSAADFEYEVPMAAVHSTTINLETIFLVAKAEHAHISSTLVRQCAKGGRRVPGFLPPMIEDEVYARLMPAPVATPKL